jgi:heptose I phosphotransferase
MLPPDAPSLTRHWPALPGDGQALLVRRRRTQRLADLWCRMRRRPPASPEQRQAALLLRLERHGVEAPQVLAMGQNRTGGRIESFLLTEPPADTCSLEAWLLRRVTTGAARARRRSVLRQAGALLRRLHEASCYLPGTGRCGLAVRLGGDSTSVVLDSVEGVRPGRRRRPGRARRDVARLRRLLRAAGCTRTDLRRFLAGYRQVNPGADGRRPATRHPTPEGRRALTPVPAGGRDTLWGRLVRGVRRLRQRADWPQFAGDDWADRILDVAVTDRFHAKQGRTTGRWVLRAPAEPGRRLAVYLKRHYRLPRWQGLLAALWPWRGWSPAFREWENLEWARKQGVPVPEVVAAAEYVGPWGRLRSFLAVEELAGMLPLNEAVPLAALRLEPPAFRRWKRGVVAEMARLTRLLHDRRAFHKDLYLCHFFLAADDTRGEPAGGWRGRVFLIDLHRLAQHAWAWRLWQSKDLAQLLYSSEIIGVDARDRLRFWLDYHGGTCRTAPWLRRGVLWRWRRYRLHNARDRQRMLDEE